MVYTIDGTNFTRRKKIPVTGAASGAQTDYQLKLAATWAAAMQADFDDVRFTKADFQTIIDAWLESKVDSTSAVVWSEFPTTPANGVDQTYYMYYGNGSIASDWDGDATFPFFDDFPGTTLDTNKWSNNAHGTVSISGSKLTYIGTVPSWGVLTSVSEYSRPKVLYQKSKFQGRTTDRGAAIGFRQYTNVDIVQAIYFANTTNQLRNFDSGSSSTANSNIGTTEKIYETVWDAATVTWKHDGVAMTGSPLNTNIPSGNMPVLFEARGGAGYGIECDWIFLTKYAANPPTAAFGTEEHQRRTPMMM